jgi:hypothetical protein
MRDEDVQREIDRAIESKTTTGWRKRQIARHDDDDIQEYARPWKGVSEREIPDIYIGDVAFLHGVKWAEAKLKERNHG